ncbi:MAG: DUF5615 family PIN-like protein [Acidobacteriota bacterium]
MTFLLDAMLPRRLARRFVALGHEAIHTLDLPLGNQTPDADLIAIADRDGRILVTKDADFASSYLVRGRPHRLLLISTGNMGNSELERCVSAHAVAIVEALVDGGFVELTPGGLAIHGS